MQELNLTSKGHAMFSQLFEVQIKEGHVDEYLELAANLKPKLTEIGGCLFLDRFRSLSGPNLLLSYQIWQDESSLVAWRVEAGHHRVQTIGREEVFSDYRIRIGQVVHEQKRDGTIWEPERLTPYNDPARRPRTYVVVSESANAGTPLTSDAHQQSFQGVYRPDAYAHVIETDSLDHGLKLGEKVLADPTTKYFRILEVVRDYGMFDRKEAPQYYPPVKA